MLAAQILTHPFTQAINASTGCDATIEKVHDAARRLISTFFCFTHVYNGMNSQMHSKNVGKFASLNLVSGIVILQQFLESVHCK